MPGNGSDDDFTPPEAYPLVHASNREPCRILANLTLHLHEHARALDSLRLEIGRDPRPVGQEGWSRIADRLDASAQDQSAAALGLRVAGAK